MAMLTTVIHSACYMHMQGWPGLDPPANARLLEGGADEVSVGLRPNPNPNPNP